jgi:hypothetical protein
MTRGLPRFDHEIHGVARGHPDLTNGGLRRRIQDFLSPQRTAPALCTIRARTPSTLIARMLESAVDRNHAIHWRHPTPNCTVRAVGSRVTSIRDQRQMTVSRRRVFRGGLPSV